MNKIKTLAVSALLAVSAHGAGAATFDLTDALRHSPTSFTMTGADGLTMTVSGKTEDGTAQRVSAHVGFGLSVGDTFVGTKEYAVFAFNRKVSLKSFTAGFVDMFDTFRAYALKGDTFEMIASGGFGVSNAVGRNQTRATVTFGAPVTDIRSYSFAIGVGDGWDRFKIRDVTVDPVSEVPVPAAGILLLSALGLTAFARRKS